MSWAEYMPMIGPLLEHEKDLRRLKGEVAKALIGYADICGRRWTVQEGLSNRRRQEASDTFKRLATELHGWLNTMPAPTFYPLLAGFGLMPKRSNVEAACGALRGISVDLFNEVDTAVDQIKEGRREIRKALGLDLGSLNDR